MKRLAVGSVILAITLLNFFQFPGHTWLQSDTQIYTPILEHMWDPTVLTRDLIAEHPHVAYTLYDETAIALRKVSGLDFRHVLQIQQFIYRALAVWGVYLIATALGLTGSLALLATAVFSLGATIFGPAVLIFEYEPVPRGYAISFVFLAIGLIAHQRHFGAGVAGAAAFLIHAPTAAAFWAVYLCLALRPSDPLVMRHRLSAFGPLALAAFILFVFSRFQAGEVHSFFTRIGPEREEIERLRASYNWISTWWKQWLPH